MDLGAAAVATVALSGAIKILGTLGGPAIAVIKGIATAIATDLLPALLEILPELTIVAATAFTFYKLFPEESKALASQAGDWISGLLEKSPA